MSVLRSSTMCTLWPAQQVSRACCDVHKYTAAVPPRSQGHPRLLSRNVGARSSARNTDVSEPVSSAALSITRRNLLRGSFAAVSSLLTLQHAPQAQAALVQFPASELHNNYILVGISYTACSILKRNIPAPHWQCDSLSQSEPDSYKQLS